MDTYNDQNERMKRRYQHYLQEARGLAPTTIDQSLRTIEAFEKWTEYADFKRFNSNAAIGFRKYRLAVRGRRPDELSNRSTVHAILMHLKQFFTWLAFEPGYKKALNVSDAEYFQLSARDTRIATTRYEKPAPTPEQLLKVVRSMPSGNDVELRNRAVVTLILLTGTRVSALISLKIKHVRPDRTGINQDAREVNTKLGKSFPSFFFPVADDVKEIFLSYVHHLRNNLLFGDNDPLFPATRQNVDEDHQFKIVGLTRSHWKTTDAVRTVFQRAFAAVGLPYYHPHSVRRTLALLGEQICKTPEEMKAWSQNLGHEQVLTTFMSYGTVPANRQHLIMQELAQKDDDDDIDEVALRALWKRLRK